MSPQVSLGLLIAVATLGSAALTYLTAQARGVWSEIATGGANGRAFSRDVRSVMVWQMWVTYALFCVVEGLLFAGLAFLVARHTEVSDIRLFGQFIGYSMLIAGLVWLVFGPWGTFVLIRDVRRAAKDFP